MSKQTKKKKKKKKTQIVIIHEQPGPLFIKY